MFTCFPGAIQYRKKERFGSVCLTLPLSQSLFLALFKLVISGMNHFFIFTIIQWSLPTKTARQTQTVRLAMEHINFQQKTYDIRL